MMWAPIGQSASLPTAAAVALVFAATGACAGETIVGRVVGVSDGDTIIVLDSRRQQLKVRLAGIDAPGIQAGLWPGIEEAPIQPGVRPRCHPGLRQDRQVSAPCMRRIRRRARCKSGPNCRRHGVVVQEVPEGAVSSAADRI